MAVDPKYVGIAEAALRLFEFIFTLLAFALMSSAVQSTRHELTQSLPSYAAINFILVSNVLAWLYSTAQIAYLLSKSMLKNRVTLPLPQIKFLSLIFDQVATVLLLSSSSAGATILDAVDLCSVTSCCSQVKSSVATGFMATIGFYFSAWLSFYIYQDKEKPTADSPA